MRNDFTLRRAPPAPARRVSERRGRARVSAPHLAEAVARNLGAGLRLAIGRPVAATDFVVSNGHLVFVFAVTWAVTLLGARLDAGAGAHFWIWGGLAFAARFQAWLVLVLALAWRANVLHHAALLLIALAYAGAPIVAFAAVSGEIALTLFGEAHLRYDTLRVASILAWWVLVFWRAAALVADFRPRLGATLGYALALAAIVVYLPAPPFFYRERQALPGLDIESIYYRQSALLNAQREALSAADPDRVELYFLAVAPYAGQDVFMREALAARNIVEQRLGLGGRTVALVNNRATIETLPLANAPNLTTAIASIGTVMDRDEDILFVYLTSHGYEDASLAADFAGLAPNDLHADTLRRALDEAGIVWRVIVISACYSGSFVDDLASPTTLVLTAAAADRTSFGCAHENHWTYFGQAFFVDALGETTDLVTAAHRAIEHVSVREQREGKESSRPQLVLGASIGAQLARLAPSDQPPRQPPNSLRRLSKPLL